MTTALHIGRLATRVRAADPGLARQVRAALDGPLARGLDGVAGRALARAGLPEDALVAVRRLSLRLRVGAAADGAALVQGWAQACEAALVGSLIGTQTAGGTSAPLAGDPKDPDLVWFADPWAAELSHLEGLAAGLPTAWWAPQLVAGSDSGGAGAAEALRPVSILARWLDQNPARAVATMTALAESGARVSTLLDPSQARALTQALLNRLGAAQTHGVGPQATPNGEAALLDQALGRVQGLSAGLLAQGGEGAQAQARPWLAAALFARTPALCLVPWTGVEALLDLALGSARPARLDGPRGAVNTGAVEPSRPRPGAIPTELLPDPQVGAQPSPKSGVGSGQEAQAAVSPGPEVWPVHAGGLLLLVRPLLKLGLLPPAASLSAGLADLALAALRRVLASLPPGDLAVAQERERPLLAVFAPGHDWRGRIAEIPIADPGAAADLLDTLAALIPGDIAFAPGAVRRIFGTPTPAIGRAEDLRLAQLLLRPGRLRLTPWEAELTWPLAAADLALRRGGWDQDPGWVPWLGRNLSFRFGGET